MKLQNIIKDYGAAIGPAFAFLLGIFALYIKYHFDKFSSKWNSTRAFEKLKALILNSPPPSHFFPNRSESLMHADQARNGTNLSHFYSRLLAINSVVSTIEKDIISHGELADIRQFHNIKWWVKVLLEQIEKIRSEGNDVTQTHFFNINESYKLLSEACEKPEESFEYIKPRA